MEAGAPGRAVLEPGLGGRPAFGDDAAVRPPYSPAPSGRGAHAVPWSWVPRWGRPVRPPHTPRCDPGPRRPRGLGADCVWRGAYPCWPKHLPGEPIRGRVGVSPPWWAQVETQGWEAGADLGWGRVPAPRASFSSPLSGLLDGSLPFLWPQDGPAQSLGKRSLRPPARLCFGATHPGSLGARGRDTQPPCAYPHILVRAIEHPRPQSSASGSAAGRRAGSLTRARILATGP